MKINRLLLALAVAGFAVGIANAKDVVVKIGAAGPLTGPSAAFGKDGEYGARLAIEEANAKGYKIGGDSVKFEIISLDDQADPSTAAAVAQRLVDSGVKGVVGHVTSGASIQASRIYEKAGIPVITPSATNPKLTNQGYKMTFRVIANDSQQGNALGKFAVNEMKSPKIAVIDDRSAYGQGLADAFVEAVNDANGKIVGREFTNEKATDFMGILTRIKASNPDAIFYGGMVAQSGLMLRQMKQLGIKSRFLTGDGGCSADIIKIAGDALNSSAYCTQAGIPPESMPGGASFRKRFKERFNTDIVAYAPYSYDATMVLIEAMKAADSVEPNKYLSSIKKISYSGVTGSISFDDKGDIKGGSITVYKYKDGKWVPSLTIQ